MWNDGSDSPMDDEIVIPVSGAPLWVLGAIVVGVFGAIVALAFYLMRS